MTDRSNVKEQSRMHQSTALETGPLVWGPAPPPFPPFVSPCPDLRRELGAIVGPSPLLQRPPPSSEQAEPRALRTRLCPLAVGRGPFAKG